MENWSIVQHLFVLGSSINLILFRDSILMFLFCFSYKDELLKQSQNVTHMISGTWVCEGRRHIYKIWFSGFSAKLNLINTSLADQFSIQVIFTSIKWFLFMFSFSKVSWSNDSVWWSETFCRIVIFVFSHAKFSTHHGKNYQNY